MGARLAVDDVGLAALIGHIDLHPLHIVDGIAEDQLFDGLMDGIIELDEDAGIVAKGFDLLALFIEHAEIGYLEDILFVLHLKAQVRALLLQGLELAALLFEEGFVALGDLADFAEHL